MVCQSMLSILGLSSQSRVLQLRISFACSLRSFREKPRSDRDLGNQGPVDWALVGDLEQPCPLTRIEGSYELYITLNLIDHPDLGFAILAVGRMYPRVPKAHANSLEGPLLAPGVESNRHRCA
jgi:hypothetical protein